MNAIIYWDNLNAQFLGLVQSAEHFNDINEWEDTLRENEVHTDAHRALMGTKTREAKPSGLYAFPVVFVMYMEGEPISYTDPDAVPELAVERHSLLVPLAALETPSHGAQAIALERTRQMSAEGWTAEHDAQWIEGEMRDAAIAYLMVSDACAGDNAESVFPASWDASWWKPTTVRRNLEKAGALIAAELDRLELMETAAAQRSGQTLAEVQP